MLMPAHKGPRYQPLRDIVHFDQSEFASASLAIMHLAAVRDDGH
jgi:hypothetical protein